MKNRDWVPYVVIILGVLLMMCAALFAYDTLKPSTVVWVGHPVVVFPDDLMVAVEDIEIGLREDGVVIWREVE